MHRLIFISKGCGPKMTASENQCYISQIFRGCHFLLEMKFNRENLKAWLILSTLLRKSTPENYIQKAKCQFWLKNLILAKKFIFVYIYNFQVWISVKVWTKPARLSNLPRLIFISKGCGPKMTASENQGYMILLHG